VQSALNGILAAVVGVILNLGLWFAVHTLFAEVRPITRGIVDLEVPVWSSIDWPALALTVIATFALFRLRAGLFAVILGGAGLGWLVRTLL
jgi:chromate transporter